MPEQTDQGQNATVSDDERQPLATGTMGHLGTTASAAVLSRCDALLIVGSNDPWTENYPAPARRDPYRSTSIHAPSATATRWKWE